MTSFIVTVKTQDLNVYAIYTEAPNAIEATYNAEVEAIEATGFDVLEFLDVEVV